MKMRLFLIVFAAISLFASFAAAQNRSSAQFLKNVTTSEGKPVSENGITYDTHLLNLGAGVPFGVTVMIQSGMPDNYFADVLKITDSTMNKAVDVCMRIQCNRIEVAIAERPVPRIDTLTMSKGQTVRVMISVPVHRSPTKTPANSTSARARIV